MKRPLKLPNDTISKLHNRSRGYILITLMLFFTVLAIAALAVLPEIVQQMKRDREEEMIHRGVQYTRAVRRYFKKFGRYPTRIEDLENSNNLRFLRKRYKDPMTGKDFKLLRLGDPQLMALGFSQGLGQGMQANMQGLQQQGTRPGFVGAQGGGIRPAGPGDANMPQITGLPGGVTTVQQQPPPGGARNPGDADSGDSGSGSGSSSDSSASSDSSSSSSSSGPGLGGQVFGGGPIVGVVSTSKAKSIREFSQKNHYSDWPFVYDPTSDRGGLLNTPTLGNPGGAMNMGGQPGAGGIQQTPGPGGTPQPGPPSPQNEPPEE